MREKVRVVKVVERLVKCSCGHEFWTRQTPDLFGFISCGKCRGKFKPFFDKGAWI